MRRCSARWCSSASASIGDVVRRWLLVAIAMTGAPVMAMAQDQPLGGVVRTERLAAGPEGRQFRVFVPDRRPPAGARPMIVMLHGCTQDAADVARGTRLDGWAAREGFVALYPQQESTHHPQKCWNWYDPAHVTRDRGEAAWIVHVVRHVAATEGIDPRRITIAGVSAGGVMAASLAVLYPEVFAAAGAHSSPPVLAATNVMSALGIMRQGATEPVAALAERAVAAMGPQPRAVPIIVWHGATDAVVHPSNATVLAEQFRAIAARTGERAAVELRVVDGVGHAWSGGAPDGTYTAPGGPDATAAFVAFLLAQQRP